MARKGEVGLVCCSFAWVEQANRGLEFRWLGHQGPVDLRALCRRRTGAATYIRSRSVGDEVRPKVSTEPPIAQVKW